MNHSIKNSQNPFYVMLDTYMHYLVERGDIKEFWRKFVRYNLRYLMPRREQNVEA